MSPVSRRSGLAKRLLIVVLGCMALAFPCSLVFLIVPVWVGFAISLVVVTAYCAATFNYLDGR